MKLAELDSFDDRDAKPQNIGLHIGRRPILAFGNSDGDLAMLRYTKPAPARAWRCCCITTTPSASSPTTATSGSARSSKRSTRRAIRHHRREHEARLEGGV